MFKATKNIPKKLFVKIFHLLGHLLAVSGVGDKSSHLADDPLDALLGLEHGHVHVLHPLQHVGGGRGLVYKHTARLLFGHESHIVPQIGQSVKLYNHGEGPY